MSSHNRHLSAIRDGIQAAVDEGIWPAVQFAVAKDGELLAFEAFGDATESDRFCLFSATKPIVASLIWQLVGEGALELGNRVADLWPEFAAHGKGTVTVEHLLLHTAGFPTATLARDRMTARGDRAEQMADWTLEWEPGSRYEYHATSAHWVLSELIHRLTAVDFREALRSRILDPLGLDRLELGVPLERQGFLKPVTATGTRSPELLKALFGTLPDEALLEADMAQTLNVANDPQLIAVGIPGAGAFGDAASVALFYQALLHNKRRIWRPGVLAMATGEIRNTFPDPLRGGAAANRTLGLIAAGPEDGAVLEISELGVTLPLRHFGGRVSPRAFGHGGAGGQSAWADPDSGLSFSLLTCGMDRDLIRDIARHQAIESHVPALI
jgi:CubicO group peptidase (beta-lactamase class C family)